MIEAVIFDMDGVLIDSEPLYCELREQYLASFGIRLTRDQADRFMGQRFLVALDEIFPQLPPDLRAAIEQDFVPWDIALQSVFRQEAREAIIALKKQGVRIAIASNSVPYKIENLIEQCGLQGMVDTWVSGAELERCKPAPDIYLKTAAQLGLSPRACAAVEDSDCGLEAACAAGCYTFCLIDRRFAFEQQQAHRWIDSLHQLPQAVSALNQP